MSESMTSRPLAWDDIALVHELASRRWAVDGPRSQMHIGDFYWALRMTPSGDPLSLARVWPRRDGSLAAFAWLDPPGLGDGIIAPDAAASALDEALDWLEAEHLNAGSGVLSILVLDGDLPRAEASRRRGYAPGEGGNVRFWRRLPSTTTSTPLPEGFALRHVVTDDDIARRVFVETTAFDGFPLTVDAWRLLMQRLPGYRPELDLIAVAPDGTGASACTCWYDETTRCGEFEAVGTSKAHQRRGIGRAVITEGLRRLHRLGATQAVVQTTIGNAPAIALYRSCGFEVVAEDHTWTKSDDIKSASASG